MRCTPFVALIGFSLAFAVPASCTTIHIVSSSQTAITNPSEQIIDNKDVAVDTNAGSTRLDANSYAYLSRPRPNLDSGHSEVKATADAATGVLQSSIFQRTFSDFTLEHTLSSNQTGLSEEFVVTGSGLLTFNLSLAGGVFGGIGGDKEFDYFSGASLRISGDSSELASDSWAINQSTNCSGFGPAGLCNGYASTFERLLTVSIFIDGAVIPTVSLSALIGSGLNRGQGDLNTTAQLTFKADRSLKLTPSDSRFLSAIPSVVPLPASLPLIASGVAFLGWLSRKRR